MHLICTLKSLAVVLLIESVTSLEDVSLNNLSLNTLSALVNILSKYKNDVAYLQIESSKQKTKEDHRNSIGQKGNSKNSFEVRDVYPVTDKKFQRPGKHILIKRLLPHGLSPSMLEFDSKYKTFYRPLVRVHKRRPVPKIGTILNIAGNANGMDKYGNDVYDYYDNDENVINFAVNKGLNSSLKHFKVKEVGDNFDIDEELLQPFPRNSHQNYESLDDLSTQLRVLEDIQKLLTRIQSRSTRMNTYHEIIKILDKISEDNLRSNHKSGEDNDATAPGKLVNLEYYEDQEGPSKPKKSIPHNAPWNYWTYKKTIYQDVCPVGQVKIGNLCIWLPPH